MKIKNEDIPKTAFKIRYRHYKLLVILFGLTNALATFMDLMNRIFKPLLDKDVIVFIDDIIVYSHNMAEHSKHLATALGILLGKKLYAKLKKYEFWLGKISFLGHIVSKDGISIDLVKVERVMNWKRLTIIIENISFLGMVGYYRRFVESFSKIVAPLTQLTRNDVKFEWTD